MKIIKTDGHVDFELQTGEHILHFYDNEEQRLNVLTEFLKDGFKKHNKSVGIVDKDTAYTVQDRLIKEDIDAGHYLIESQLVFITHDEFYTTNALFDEKRLMDIITHASDVSMRQGWDGLSLANELTWAVTSDNVDSWLKFEANINNYMTSLPILMLCQYNQRLIPGQIVTNLIKTHPFVIMSDDVYQNPYYIDPNKFLKAYVPNDKYYA